MKHLFEILNSAKSWTSPIANLKYNIKNFNADSSAPCIMAVSEGNAFMLMHEPDN